jgi:hypothetical protein
MTGPEHYRKAERLLERATDPQRRHLHLEQREAMAAAQVHATLALAAATIAAAAHPGQSQTDYLGQWWDAGA